MRFEAVKLTPWLIDEHASFRAVVGTDYSDPKNRRAFIEKTPRVFRDGEWHYGPKGHAPEYGKHQPSRDWCDTELKKIGYELT